VQTTKTSVHGRDQHAGPRQALKCKIFQASTSEVYGDPSGPPADGDYWGNVNPIGPRSCYDEGKRCAETLFFDYRRQHGLRSRSRASSTPTGRGCTRRRPRGVQLHRAGAEGRADHDLRRRQPDALLLLRRRSDRGLRAADGQRRLEVTGPINLGNPGEFTIRELAEKVAASEAGEFEFYCSVPGHRQAGMFGSFIVVE
jgi:UDP-glucuronate decarboxylase